MNGELVESERIIYEVEADGYEIDEGNNALHIAEQCRAEKYTSSSTSLYCISLEGQKKKYMSYPSTSMRITNTGTVKTRRTRIDGSR